jgi:four helix bundle protein
MMSYEKLDVYQCAIEFLGIAAQIIERLPRGYSVLADQIRRASFSMPLNIAEGAGKRSRVDCRKHFDIARGSAMESGAVVDVCIKLELVPRELLMRGKQILERVVSMLTRLADPDPSPKPTSRAQAHVEAHDDAHAHVNAHDDLR